VAGTKAKDVRWPQTGSRHSYTFESRDSHGITDAELARQLRLAQYLPPKRSTRARLACVQAGTRNAEKRTSRLTTDSSRHRKPGHAWIHGDVPADSDRCRRFSEPCANFRPL